MAGLGLVCFLVMVNLHLVVSVRPLIVENVRDLQPAQAAIIPGAGVYPGGRLSHIAYDRLMTGIELYKRGLVAKLLLSGDHGRKSYDEVNNMKQWALDNGVADQDIFLDHAGFSTWDTVARAKRVFCAESVIIVTQRYHLPRALFIAGAHDLSAQGYPADRRRYRGIIYYSIRESLARAKDWVNAMLLHPDPKFLGDTMPLAGDGRVTRD